MELAKRLKETEFELLRRISQLMGTIKLQKKEIQQLKTTEAQLLSSKKKYEAQILRLQETVQTLTFELLAGESTE